ncbi:hypothetical protein GCM10023317_25720 [Actinopolymorpha pittospori]
MARRPRSDRAADFFDLGGDFLLAIRGAAAGGDRGWVVVPVREFLGLPTLVGLPAAVRGVGVLSSVTTVMTPPPSGVPVGGGSVMAPYPAGARIEGRSALGGPHGSRTG